MLLVENLTVSTHSLLIQEHDSILKNISFKIKSDSVTCLIGESGAGKTVLAKSLCALLPKGIMITEGKIFYGQHALSFSQMERLRGDILFYVPQNAPASLNPVIKIKHQIKETSKMSMSQLETLLFQLNFYLPQRILNSYPFELSGGENQRCLLAMAIAAKPKILILDEPTNALDFQTQKGFISLLDKLRKQYKLTILLITHNLFFAKQFADYVYIILKGEIVEHGDALKLFSNPEHHYTRQIVQYLNTYF